MKREWLMLAQTFDPAKHGPAGWFMSEKLDGMRAYWDGGITRGLHVKDVPFANTEKDYIRVNQDIRATGLWSRGGKVIHAPESWLDKLPKFPLDGELYAGKNNFQLVTSIVKDLNPCDVSWKNIQFMVFDIPPYEHIFADGIIDFKTHKKSLLGIDGWAQVRAKDLRIIYPCSTPMYEVLCSKMERLKSWIENTVVKFHKQEQLPWFTKEALNIIENRLDEITINGGEGLMLRKPGSTWTPERSWSLLKVKKWLDSEAICIGYVWGRKTDKGSKLLGKMGAMIVNWRGVIFELSGFTDEEREITFAWGNSAEGIGRVHPGERIQNGLTNPKFPIGCAVTFRYRELSDAGVPKEARYLRKYSGL